MRTPTIAAAMVTATVALGGAASAQAETISFTGAGGAVPDGNAAGASFDISVPDTRLIRAAGNNVTLTLINVSTPSTGWTHPFGGLVDFAATLEHVGSGAPRSVFANVLNQDNFICVAGLNGTYTFRSGEPTTLRSQCGSGGAFNQPPLVPPGTYRTTEPDDTADSGLSSAWNAQPAAGTWRLHISDTNVNTLPGQFVMNTTWTWRLDIEVVEIARAPGKGPGRGPGRLPPGACANARNGTSRSDTLTGSAAGDRLFGLAGDDRLFGLAGADCLSGGSGADRLAGGDGRDRVSGNSGRDVLSGGAGSDLLGGGPGDDRVDGGAGDDAINPGSGRDRVRGGSGDDRLVLRGKTADVADCGPGRDSAHVDRFDRVRRCERVMRR